MKTKLPSKIKAPTISFSGSTRITNAPLSYTDLTLNQLIDYLAELTTVVEGKMDKPQNVTYGGGVSGIAGTLGTNPYTLTLKETLLDAMMAVSFQEHSLQKPRVQLEDVVAIINRLMP